jgi:hypothetical protein
MKDRTILIITGGLGLLFAVFIRVIGMSPAQYVLDHYGFPGIIVYAVVVLGVGGLLLYIIGKKQTELKPLKDIGD